VSCSFALVVAARVAMHLDAYGYTTNPYADV
jgi:hypothetical protein